MILCCGPGRFANQFFRNMYGKLLSEKLNMGIQYTNPEPFREIGLDFQNRHRTRFFHHTIMMKEEDCMQYLTETQNRKISYNINFDQCFCQSTAFAKHILDNFFTYQPKIENLNPFKARYQKNNDIYIHYRIGDLIELNFLNPHEYYEKMLQRLIVERKINGDEGKIFISTDSPTHESIFTLVKKYNAKIISLSLPQTILFASTCKYLILSLGTFSWLIGLYGFYSEKYFLNPRQIRCWHGPIFEATEGMKSWHMQTMKIEHLPQVDSVNGPLYWKKEYYNLKQYEFSKTQICFIHLPRTAGTSLQKYFSTASNEAKLALQPCCDIQLETTDLIKLQTQPDENVSVSMEPRIVYKSRHPVSFLCPASEYQYITIFRNPVERVWAFYQMEGKNYLDKNLTANIKYFCDQCWEASNLYTRLFAGETIEHNIPKPELLKRAKENMKLFFYILDFEKFSEEINILRKKIHPSIYDNWAYPESVPHEQGFKYDRKIPTHDRNIIEEANRLDLELYQFFKNGMK